MYFSTYVYFINKCLLEVTKCFVANAGDTRAVLVYDNYVKTLRLTIDHKASNFLE